MNNIRNFTIQKINEVLQCDINSRTKIPNCVITYKQLLTIYLIESAWTKAEINDLLGYNSNTINTRHVNLSYSALTELDNNNDIIDNLLLQLESINYILEIFKDERRNQ